MKHMFIERGVVGNCRKRKGSNLLDLRRVKWIKMNLYLETQNQSGLRNRNNLSLHTYNNFI